MPATPFPHPSVHTTTTVHSLTCSRIRASVTCSGQSFNVTRINANKSSWKKKKKISFGLPRPQKAFHKCSSKWIHLKILVSHCAVDWESSADLRSSCDAFLKSLDLLVHVFPKCFFKTDDKPHRRKRCTSAGAGSSGLPVAKKWDSQIKCGLQSLIR